MGILKLGKKGLFVEGEFFESGSDVFGGLERSTERVDDYEEGIGSEFLDVVEILGELMFGFGVDRTLNFEPDDVGGSAKVLEELSHDDFKGVSWMKVNDLFQVIIMTFNYD